MLKKLKTLTQKWYFFSLMGVVALGLTVGVVGLVRQFSAGAYSNSVYSTSSFTATKNSSDEYGLSVTGVTYDFSLVTPAQIGTSESFELSLSETGSSQAAVPNFYNAQIAVEDITITKPDDSTITPDSVDWQADSNCSADSCSYRRLQLATPEVIPQGSTIAVTIDGVVNPANAGLFFLNFAWVDEGASIRYSSSADSTVRRVFDDPSSPTLLFKAKIVDPTGAAVPNANVWMHTANYNKTAYATTYSDGAAYLFSTDFEIFEAASPDGDYIVEVRAPADSSYTDPTSNPTVTIATGSTNTTYYDSPISLTRPQLSGTVVVPSGCSSCTAEAGSGVPNVSVDVNDSNWDPTKSKHTFTAQNGTFQVGGLSAGTYTLEFRMPPSAGSYLGTTAPETVQNIVVAENGNVTYDETETAAASLPVNLGNVSLQLATKTVTGQVTKSDGSGVSTARIMAFNMNGFGMAETTTDSNGNYTLSMGGGNWMIRPEVDFSANFDNDDSNDVTASWIYCGMGRNVNFANDQTEESKTGNFQVKETVATITGKVAYPNGDPVSGAASVNVFSKDGCGAFAPLDWGTGQFSVALPAGTFNVNVESWNEDYSSPTSKTVTVSSGTTDIGTLSLQEKNARITGRLWADSNGNGSYDSGEGVSGVMIDGFKMSKKFDQHAGPGPGPMGGGGGFAHTTSGSNGSFTLKVTQGTWMVNVMADMGMMHGGYSENSTNYIYTGAPRQVAISTSSTTSSGNNFELEVADATINGRLWTDTNSNDQFDDGEAVSGIWGFAFAEPSGSYNQGPMMGAGMGAPINNGVFEIKVPAGDYEVGTDFPPENSSYTPSGMTTVSVSSGSSATANVEVLPNNATLRVQFKDASGNLVTNLAHAEVFLDNPAGGHQWKMFTSEELSSGYADIAVSAGTWRVGYFIDPTENNYMSSPTTDNKVTTVADQTVTRNITLQEANSTVSGTVKDPSGSALSGVFVSVDNRKADAFDPMGGMMFMNGEVTAADGSYSLNLPAGTYKVQAFFPPEAVVGGQTVNYLNPEPKEVTISSASPATANFQFKQSDATLSGKITLNGSDQGAFISAYSDKGGYNETTSTSGSYSLSVTKNDTWYVRAFFEDGSTVYLSDVVSVAMGGSSSVTQNLTLEQAPFTVPDSVSSSFNCANAKKISLSNGAEISIPASAIQPSSVNSCSSSESSSNITITVSPTTQMSLQDKSVPIGVGYEITAVDSNGATISDTFNSNVTITIPYDDTQMQTSLGGGSVDESLLGNGYWDTSTSSWRNVSSEVLDTENNKLTISTNHFTLFGVLAATDPNSTSGSATPSTGFSSLNSPQAPGCGDAPPYGKAPWLYAVRPESSSSLRLYFADADGPLDHYALTYGLGSNDYIFGSDDIGGKGLRSYLVQHLSPNTTYYFRVRAGNGCAIGAWSNEMAGTTYGGWHDFGLDLTTQASSGTDSVEDQTGVLDLDSSLTDEKSDSNHQSDQARDKAAAKLAAEQVDQKQADQTQQEPVNWLKYAGWTAAGAAVLIGLYFLLTKWLR
ncbi:MAG: hypothetical protein GF381_00550 [Candidatus Pacebacteria bacterium]|nr:hypothetical protein [Candidatus Paceibacterota bacterium]